MEVLIRGYKALFSPTPVPRVMDSSEVIETAWRSVGDRLQEAMQAYEQETEKMHATDHTQSK